MKVLEISEENRDYTGKGDAYGVIADIYTDLVRRDLTKSKTRDSKAAPRSL